MKPNQTAEKRSLLAWFASPLASLCSALFVLWPLSLRLASGEVVWRVFETIWVALRNEARPWSVVAPQLPVFLRQSSSSLPRARARERGGWSPLLKGR